MASAGKLNDLEVTVIGPDTIRVDYYASVPPYHHDDERHSVVIDLDTARAAAVCFMEAINRAELSAARASKKGKRK